MATPLAFQHAYDAIQSYVAERFPEQSDAWDAIVPSGPEWGFTAQGWRAAASRIVAAFNALLPSGVSVNVPPAAKDNHLDRPMIEFQRYLAALADRRASVRALERLEV